MHVPPLNVLSCLILPFTVIKTKGVMLTVSKIFSKIIFWVENIIFIAIFAAAEAAIFPLVFLKSIVNVIISSSHLDAKSICLNTLKVLGFGWLQLLGIWWQDIFSLTKILAMHNGCKEGQSENNLLETKEDIEEKIKAKSRKYLQSFNEVREIVIKMYMDIKEQADREELEDELQNDE